MRFAILDLRNTSTPALPLFAVAALVVACSSESAAPPPAANPFDGTWRCQVTITSTLTAPTPAPPETSQATASIVTKDVGGELVLEDAVDGGDVCDWPYGISGNRATLAHSTTCTKGGLAFTYTMGTYVVNGDALTGTVDYTASGTVLLNDAGPAVMIAGYGTQAWTCTRM